MAIEAPLSRYKRNSFLIYIVVCLVLGLWFGYDGYLNKTFIAKYTDEQGKADSTLLFNRYSPPVFLGLAGVLAAYFYAIRGRKVVAEDNELVIAGRQRIPYDAIESIDKTHFEKKGFFTITYKSGNGAQVRRKLGDRSYDNLGPILDHLIAKIT
jgi:hypothetical protein